MAYEASPEVKLLLFQGQLTGRPSREAELQAVLASLRSEGEDCRALLRRCAELRQADAGGAKRGEKLVKGESTAENSWKFYGNSMEMLCFRGALKAFQVWKKSWPWPSRRWNSGHLSLRCYGYDSIFLLPLRASCRHELS